jgi:AAA+ ATPase superfamily predicted ATPase
MIPDNFLEAVAREHKVSENELLVLKLALEGRSIAEIVEQIEMKQDIKLEENAARKRLGEVYRKFDITGAGPGKLAKLHHRLDELYEKKRTNQVPTASLGEAEPLKGPDWGEAPASSRVFYGRNAEIRELKREIVEECKPLVTLIGRKGIGKTALAIKVVEEISKNFDAVVWRSLEGDPPPLFPALISDILPKFTSLESPSKSPALTPHDPFSLFFKSIGQRRCLLVLDDFESILATENEADGYREGYSEYGKFLEQLGTKRHRVTTLLLSSENPKTVDDLRDMDAPVHTLWLKGLKHEEARDIFEEKELEDAKPWEELVDILDGDPSGLSSIANKIQQVFEGKVSDYPRQDNIILRQAEERMAQQFQKLSTIEKKILYFLTVSDASVTFNEITKNVNDHSPEDLLEAVSSLGRRFLVSRESPFTIDPSMKKYIGRSLQNLPDLEKEILSFLIARSTPASFNEIKKNVKEHSPEALFEAIGSLNRRLLVSRETPYTVVFFMRSYISKLIEDHPDTSFERKA